MKKIISAAIAIVAAYFLFKVIWWVFRSAFVIALTAVEIFVVILIAAPIYFYVRRKLIG